MTFAEIQAEVCRLEIALKAHGQDAEVSFDIKSGRSSVYLTVGYGAGGKRPFDGEARRFIHGDTPREILDAAWAIVNALPDPEAAERQQWHRSLADVIDAGQALALPEEVLSPLRQGSQAMHDNLLTYEAEAST